MPIVEQSACQPQSRRPVAPPHHVVEDIALMSALPNMNVYCPADAAEVLRRCLPPTGPAYVRLSARQDPVVFGDDDLGDPHEVRLLRDGPDALVVATGRCVAEAVAAADRCAERGLDIAVGAVTCLRPFPADQVRSLLQQWPVTLTGSPRVRWRPRVL
jgi:transketolase